MQGSAAQGRRPQNWNAWGDKTGDAGTNNTAASPSVLAGAALAGEALAGAAFGSVKVVVGWLIIENAVEDVMVYDCHAHPLQGHVVGLWHAVPPAQDLDLELHRREERDRRLSTSRRAPNKPLPATNSSHSTQYS